MSKPELVTIEDIKKALPSRKNTITQEIVDIINESQMDATFQGESLMQSAVTYESVMVNNKASIREFLDAVKFCAYLTTMEDNFTEAYKRTFYYRDFVSARMDAGTETNEYKELTSAASRYRKSKLVVNLLTISQVPLDLMFTGARYKALGVLSDVMVNAKFDRDKINAAKELLAATTSNELKVDLSVGPNATAVSMQDQMNEQLSILAANQKRLLENGADISDVQKTNLQLGVIEAEIE